MYIANKLLALAQYIKLWSDTKLWLISILGLLLVVSIRFNRNQLIFNRPLNDARYFIAYVEHFRGKAPSDVIRPATNWRILVPWCAAWLPFEPLTAINLINVAFVFLAVLALFNCAKQLGINRELNFVGLWLFIFSFPTFYYSTIGYTDAAVVGLTMLCVYCVLKYKVTWLLLFFGLGFLAKETILVIIPFATIYFYLNNKKKLALITCLILSLIYILLSAAVRKYAYLTPGETNHLFWQINQHNVMLNITRLNSVLAPFLGFGLVGYLYVMALRNVLMSKYRAMAVASLFTVLGGIALYTFAFTATYADARPIWLVYFAMILVVLLWLQTKLSNYG